MTHATRQYLLGLAITERERAAAAMIAAGEETSVEYGRAAFAVRELLDESLRVQGPKRDGKGKGKGDNAK